MWLTLAGVLTALVLVATVANQIVDTNFYVLPEAVSLLAGDRPYRDFIEWGAPLAAYASAGMQVLVGYRLIGEFALQWICITGGAIISTHLGIRFSRSAVATMALLPVPLVILTQTPSYHYSKLLFFPLALWMAWRYLDLPSPRRAVALAVVVATAFLFRHDYGVWLGAQAICAFALARTTVPESRAVRSLLTDAAAFAVTVVVIVSPWLVLVHANEGLTHFVLSRASEYESAEGGTVYGRLLAPGRFLAMSPFDRNAALLWLQWVTLFVPIALIVSGILDAVRQAAPRRAVSAAAAQAVLAGVGLALIDAALIRQPTYLVIVAPMTAALSARFIRWPGSAPEGADRAWAYGRWTVSVMLAATTGVAAVSWARDTPLFRPSEIAGSVGKAFSRLVASPPVAGAGPLVFHYLHDCTAPGDRLLVTGPTPYDVNYYAERPMAGGHLFWHQHWGTDPETEARSLAMLERQSVPFVFSSSAPVFEDFQRYPAIARYLAAYYVPVKTFDGRLLVDTRRRPTGRFGPDALPCFGMPATRAEGRFHDPD
ncbi:MAG TPA: hypothetical protein VG871_24925 [Vicinamibacterales bacterium]|nr:hypothetical protein [Vicinamibacterales bacterium]